MATSENQPQSIILDVLILLFHWIARRRFDLLGELPQGRIVTDTPPHAVDRLEAAGRYEPCARIGWEAITGPLFYGSGEGFVQGFLCGVEVTKQPDQCRQYLARLRTVDDLYLLAYLCRRIF